MSAAAALAASIAELGITAEELRFAVKSDPFVADYLAQIEGTSWSNFVPRPDRPEAFDQQHSFCYNRDQVAFLIGGNGAGTTEASAFKTSLFLLRQQPPPRRNTPFWVIGNSYEQVCDTCWGEKLLGHGHIPECEIDWDNISWLEKSTERPLQVPLKPWPGRPGKNWTIQFKSYEQGRRQFQARSIGGFWFSEQFPQDLFLEVFRGCREYLFPGGQFCEFTPIEPELCLWMEHLMEEPPPGWTFYRCNTEMNKPNLADGWYEQFFASVPDEMLATRKTGQLASFEGVIYPSFNTAVHVVDHKQITFPKGAWHYRGIDWGSSAEHPFVCLWGYRDGAGDWTIYDEYWCPDQDKITADHIKEITGRHRWPASNPHFGPAFADPSRPGEINAFNAGGIPTQPAANAIYKGIDAVRTLFKIDPRTNRPRVRISRERCPHLVEELRKYRWLKGRKPSAGAFLNPGVAAPKPLKRDDDTCDAFRYLVYSVERQGAGGPPDSARYQSDSPARESVPLRRGAKPRWFTRSK